MMYSPRLTHRGRSPNAEKTKKDNIMGIGPQNSGAPGMSGKSKPCGSPLKKISNSLDGPGVSPLAFNDKLEAAVDSGKIKGGFANAIKNNK